MNSAQRTRLFHDAVDLLVHRQILRTQPANPDRYTTTATKAKRSELHELALEILGEDETLTVEELADLLDPASVEPRAPEPVNVSSKLPTVQELTETWSREGCLDAEQTRERIAAIKAALGRKASA